MLNQKIKFSQDLTTLKKKLSAPNHWKLASSRDELLISYSIQNDYLSSHKHKGYKNGLSGLYSCIYAYICVYVIITINEKKGDYFESGDMALVGGKRFGNE